MPDQKVSHLPTVGNKFLQLQISLDNNGLATVSNGSGHYGNESRPQYQRPGVTELSIYENEWGQNFVSIL